MYRSARLTQLLFSIIGALVGLALGAGVFHRALLRMIGTLAGGAAGGFAGFRYGGVRATEIRAKAQAAMCLAEIEQNTRRS
jgi:uncharacterized protein YcfJ